MHRYFTHKLIDGQYIIQELGGIAKYLGRLEDIEEELGIDLITLFKALRDGFYAIYTPSNYPIGEKDNITFDFEDPNKHGYFVNGGLVAYNDLNIDVSNRVFTIGCLSGSHFCEFKFYSCLVSQKGQKERGKKLM